MEEFRFKCTSCDEWHVGMPTFGAKAPLDYYAVPEEELSTRCVLGSDTCEIDGEFFYVRGCIEIHVHGHDEPFIWGVWVSVSPESYKSYLSVYGQDNQSHVGPFFGWLSASVQCYPDTINLKTMLHLRDNGIRPYIELEPTDHPLAIEQREGITVERVAQIYAEVMHAST